MLKFDWMVPGLISPKRNLPPIRGLDSRSRAGNTDEVREAKTFANLCVVVHISDTNKDAIGEIMEP